MWQVEDTIRAFGLDIDRLQTEYLPAFRLTGEELDQETEWLENLIAMMREEGCQQQGHLQINRGTLSLLIDLHQQLLSSPRHPFYSTAYYKVLPYIVELRVRSRKGGAEGTAEVQPVGELETCFNCLYGVMLLRLQKKEITEETKAAVASISHLLALLADAYKKEKAGDLEL